MRLIVVYAALMFSLGAVAEPDESAVRELYHQYCSVCHGDMGDGNSRANQGLNPPPKDFTETGLSQRLSRDAMISIVMQGKPGTAMTGWKTRIDSEQAEGLVDYIRVKFMGVQEPAQTDNPGAAIYSENCSVCHGDRGESALWGGESLQTVPRDFSREWLPGERMVNSVTYGVSGTPMPGFGKQLSSREIGLVVAYVQGSLMPVAAQAQEHATQSVTGGQGDSTRGQALYLGNCVECHGLEGNGEGPRAYFIYPRPQSFIAEGAKRFDRENLFTAIRDGVRGREMPAWGKVMEEQQIRDIAEFVYGEFIYREAK